jgi:hypothetical protein
MCPRASRLKKPLLWPKTLFACTWNHCELMARPYQKNASIHKPSLLKSLLDPGYQHSMSAVLAPWTNRSHKTTQHKQTTRFSTIDRRDGCSHRLAQRRRTPEPQGPTGSCFPTHKPGSASRQEATCLLSLTIPSIVRLSCRRAALLSSRPGSRLLFLKRRAAWRWPRDFPSACRPASISPLSASHSSPYSRMVSSKTMSDCFPS